MKLSAYYTIQDAKLRRYILCTCASWQFKLIEVGGDDYEVLSMFQEARPQAF